MLLVSSLGLIVIMIVAGWAITRRDVSPGTAGKQKLGYLEGLRGLAAFSVVLCHFCQMYFPAAITGVTAVGPPAWEAALPFTPLFIFYSGGFAVALFFVLSGFVLSYPFFLKGEKSLLVSAAFRRYFRLLGPILLAHLVGLAFYGVHHSEFMQVLATNEPLGWERVARPEPTLTGTLKEAFFGVFVQNLSLEQFMTPALWTMRLEFVGSLLLFAVLFFLGSSWVRYPASLALMIFLPRQFVWCFLAGMLICELAVSNRLQTWNRWPVKAALLGIGLYCGAFPIYFDAGLMPETLYGWAGWGQSRPPWSDLGWGFLSVGAVALLVFVLLSKTSQGFLSQPVLLLLGNLSFALYLLHYYFLKHLMPPLVLGLAPLAGYSASAWLAFLFVLPLMMGASYLAYLTVDRGTVKASKQLSAWSAKLALRLIATTQPLLLALRPKRLPWPIPEGARSR